MTDKLKTKENQIQIPDELWRLLNKNYIQVVVNPYFQKDEASITFYGEVDLFFKSHDIFGDSWSYDLKAFNPCNITFWASDFNIDLSNITDWRQSLTNRPEGL